MKRNNQKHNSRNTTKVSPQVYKMLAEKKKERISEADGRTVVRSTISRNLNAKPQSIFRPTKTALPQRPHSQYLTSINKKVTKILLPEAGSFNAGLATMPNTDKYICVYRPNEYSFIGCFLDNRFKVEKNSFFKFSMGNCADPRLIWLPDGRLLMVYSSTNETGLRHECIRGCIVMDLNKSTSFIDGKTFRISPESVTTRQKNWMPFLHDNNIYLTASVCPHIVYGLTLNDQISAEQKFETDWFHPWIYKDFLRGNTNIVQLDDGNYLGTFHTAVWRGARCYYDNGCYMFEGKPPFKVIKCANRTYLPAEEASQAHFRKKNLIVCNFPVGMVKENDRLLISYGDNDSIVKIMETTVQDMLNTMLDTY